MKRAIIITVVVLALAGVVAASILRESDGKKGKEVYAEPAERDEVIQVVKASGQIDPRVKVELSSHVVARIERLYVAEGEDVEAGQKVLELERKAFEAPYRRAAAQLEIARTQKRQAEVDLADAELKKRRYERAAAAGVESEERLEMARLEHESAGLRLAQVAEEIRRAQADVEKARDDLAKVTIYAPLAGRVIELNAEEGEVVVSGTMNNPASKIMTIADLSEILIEVEVDETEIVEVRPGQQVRVLVDALPDEVYAGRVVEIGSSGSKNPQRGDVTFFRVKILLDDPDERLRPGMSARAEIEVAIRADAVVVPIQAVVYRPPLGVAENGDAVAEDAVADGGEEDEIRVVFAVEDGTAAQRPVEIGISDATRVEVLSGIEAGTPVVTGPYRILRDLEHGDAVHVEEIEAPDEDDDDGGSDG